MTMLMLIIILIVAVLDQATKFLIFTSFDLEHALVVIPGLFNLRHVRNTGAAIGIMTGYNSLLVLFSCLVLAGLITFRRHLVNGRTSHKLALALMIGGIIGNLFDRIRFGYVVDFLDFYWRTHHFPTFNIADSSICIGVGLYVILSYLGPHRAFKVEVQQANE